MIIDQQNECQMSNKHFVKKCPWVFFFFVFGWSTGTEKETQWSLMNVYYMCAFLEFKPNIALERGKKSSFNIINVNLTCPFKN